MRFVTAALLVLLIAPACLIRAEVVTIGPDPQPMLDTVEVVIGDARFAAEVADDEEERRRGLMFRSSLGVNAGMLFVFDDVAERRFWMLNTLIPLDLISIRDGVVVAVQAMVPCDVPDCPLTVTPPADAALEVNAGAAVGIEPGDQVMILAR